jgi:positive phototaxis protein PixI
MSYVAAPPIEQQFLSFRIAPNLGGILSTDQLNAILTVTVDEIVPIPGAPAAVIGVYNWRGEVLWLVDIGYAINLQPIVHRHHPFVQYSVIVVNHATGKFGIVVEQVEQMRWIDRAVIQSSPAALPSLSNPITRPSPRLNSPCIAGYWQTPAALTCIEINLGVLIQQLHF